MKKRIFVLTLAAFCAIPFILGAAETASEIDRLNQAILSNTLDVVTQLAGAGVDLNGKDSEGCTPLEMVLVMNNCEAFEILLKNGANPHFSCGDGIDFIDKVMDSHNSTLMRILENYSPSRDHS